MNFVQPPRNNQFIGRDWSLVESHLLEIQRILPMGERPLYWTILNFPLVATHLLLVPSMLADTHMQHSPWPTTRSPFPVFLYMFSLNVRLGNPKLCLLILFQTFFLPAV
jgi:hypothetical protein